MRPGQPTKLTPEARRQALEIARKGRFKAHVAACLRVTTPTLYNWLKADAAFALDYAAAEAVGEEALLTTALRGGDEGKAAAWYLERWRQQRFGRRERHEVTGKKGGPVQHNVHADDDLLERLTRAAAGAAGPGRGEDGGGAG